MFCLNGDLMMCYIASTLCFHRRVKFNNGYFSVRFENCLAKILFKYHFQFYVHYTKIHPHESLKSTQSEKRNENHLRQNVGSF